MPFWKKAFSKRTGVYYPQTVVQGKPVETETIAKDLSKISTVSNSDVQAVRRDAHTYVAREKRAYQGTGLLPLRARHEGREGCQGLQFRETSASRARAVHPRTYPDQRRCLHPCAGRYGAVGVD